MSETGVPRCPVVVVAGGAAGVRGSVTGGAWGGGGSLWPYGRYLAPDSRDPGHTVRRASGLQRLQRLAGGGEHLGTGTLVMLR